MKNLNDLFDKLELKKGNGLYITSENEWRKKCNFPSRVKRLINHKLKPDAFFVFDNKPLLLFYDSPKEISRIHKALWNFNESPIVFFVFNHKVDVYNGFNYIRTNSLLEVIPSRNYIDDFNYFNLVTGKTWKKFQNVIGDNTRVDFHLLRSIETAHEILTTKHNLSSSMSNTLIGKVIFVRYLIDRKIKIGYKEEKYWTNNDFCDLLESREDSILFFRYLEDKFNGDMFKFGLNEEHLIKQEALNTIIRLLNEDILDKNQTSMFQLFDFSIIPIEFISNVYETFIGKEDQEEDGAYYTPLFLVDYILNETVDDYLIRSNDYNCKVLDPACGSGIFLVETLRKIIEKYKDLHPDLMEDSEEFKEGLRNIAKNNIFGIDKNLSAIQVAIFSIQLTLLDYQEPSSIETFKLPSLLKSNFFHSDFFNLSDEYNYSFDKIVFNFIIGNPPWKRGKSENSNFYISYVKERHSKEKRQGRRILPAISNSEIAQAFLLRVSDFKVENRVVFIVTSKVMYNTKGDIFRKYFLENNVIHRILELAPVRHQIFNKSHDPAIAPPAILFFKPSYGNSKNVNEIEHITIMPSRLFYLFQIFTISSYDFKYISQNKLIEYDWLWKVLVYGNFNDFNFIKRLKEEFSNIGEEISDVSRYRKGQGVTIGGKDKNNANHLIGMPFIKTSKNSLKPYWVNINKNNKWELNEIHRPRNPDLFTAPMLLIKKGISSNFNLVSAVNQENAVFTDSLTSVKPIKLNLLTNLYTMTAILNSKLASYLALQTFSSIGIEREQVHDEKWELPFKENNEISQKVISLQEKLAHFDNNEDFIINSENLSTHNAIIHNIKEIEELIHSLFNISRIEKLLIDYSTTVIIPIIKNHLLHERLLNPVGIDSSTIKEYCLEFINEFSPLLETENQKFQIDVLHSSKIIGMYFKVVPKNKFEEIITYKKLDDTSLYLNITKLSTKKITERLFIQKAVRGFEKDFFYIFKPNEKRLWHPAISLIDINDFKDSILKFGRRNYEAK